MYTWTAATSHFRPCFLRFLLPYFSWSIWMFILKWISHLSKYGYVLMEQSIIAHRLCIAQRKLYWNEWNKNYIEKCSWIFHCIFFFGISCCVGIEWIINLFMFTVYYRPTFCKTMFSIGILFLFCLFSSPFAVGLFIIYCFQYFCGIFYVLSLKVEK